MSLLELALMMIVSAGTEMYYRSCDPTCDSCITMEPGGVSVADVATSEAEVRCVSTTQVSGWNQYPANHFYEGWCDAYDNIWGESEFADGCQVLSWQEAHDFCIAEGGRLPTREEVEAGCSRGTGCGYNCNRIWTSTPSAVKHVWKFTGSGINDPHSNRWIVREILGYTDNACTIPATLTDAAASETHTSFSGSYANIIDGDLSTFWHSNQNTGSSGKWLQVETYDDVVCWKIQQRQDIQASTIVVQQDDITVATATNLVGYDDGTLECLVCPASDATTAEYYRSCGNPGCQSCLNLSPGGATITELATEVAEVRCVSETQITDWTYSTYCDPLSATLWVESDVWQTADDVCLTMTWQEAHDFCAAEGARLPTLEEVEGDCVGGSGCNYGCYRIWTSTAVPDSVNSAPTPMPSLTPTQTPVYCATFTCPDSMKHKAGYELIEGDSENICCDIKMCNDYPCSDEDGDHIVAGATTEGYTFDTCCVCSFGTNVFYGAVAVGDYIINGESGDGTPTMSITLPIPSDITVTELTWYQGDSSGDYSPSNTNSWEVTDVNSCKKHYKYYKTIPTFFGSAAKWSMQNNAIFATITMAGTKTVTEMFGSFTETYQRSVRHAIGVQVGLTTTSSVTANFYMSYEDEQAGYSIVTGIVDNFAADGSEVTLTLILKSPDCMQETASLVKGSDYVVASKTGIAIGAASLDTNDLCQQEVIFTFQPNSCYAEPQDFQLSFTSRNDHPLTVDIEVMIECTSFLDNLPILATLTFHASQDTLTTEQTTFQLGEEVYALLDTSTLVPLTNIEIEKVVVVQTGYSGAEVSTQLKPIEDVIYEYTDQYPAPDMGADTAMMMWDLESSHFTVSASGATAKTIVDFRVTYDSGYTFRRSLEVDTKFNDPELEEQEFGYTDDMMGEFKIVDEGMVGVQDVGEEPKSFMKYILLGVVAAAALAGYRHYQSKAKEEKSLLNVYNMEEDVF